MRKFKIYRRKCRDVLDIEPDLPLQVPQNISGL
jgi:hypothetical protein